MKEETEIPVRAYSKKELAILYKIGDKILHKWLTHWTKELKALKYDDRQQILTVAQVRFLFRDDVLGKP
jgi:hypothetical protein